MLVPPSKQLVDVIGTAWDADVSVHELGALVCADPDLSESILRYANSPFMGMGREVDNPLRATLLLGATVIGNLAVCHALTSAVRRVDLPKSTIKTFWGDCLRRACAAVGLAQRHADIHTDMAFTVGLTLEFGRLMLLTEAPHEVIQVNEVRKLHGAERLEMEEQIFGNHHHAIFLEQAEGWGLPAQLLDAVRDHHQPIDDLPVLSKVAHWADMCAECYSAVNKAEARERIAAVLVEQDGWDLKGAKSFLNGLGASMAAAADMLAIQIGEPMSLDHLIRQESTTTDPETMNRQKLLAYLQEVVDERNHLHKQILGLQAELQALSQFDPLTGLSNRNRYIQTLRQEVMRAQRYGQELSVVIVDVDDFTSLNARYGQEAGDQVLRRVAALLSRVSREVDFLARIGGDEFAVILPETARAGGRIFAERVRAGLEAQRVDVGDGRLLISGTVVGVTLASQSKDVNHERLHATVMKASANLKARGGNRTSWAA